MILDATVTFDGRQYVAVVKPDGGMVLVTKDGGVPIAEQLVADVKARAEGPHP